MPDLSIEKTWPNTIIAGVDEAGRGPLMGPVFACAVIIDQNKIIDGIKDSKKLSPSKREKLYDAITSQYEYAIGIAESYEIDELNILEATKLACKRAVASLKTIPKIVLVDGNMKFQDSRFKSIIKGDDISLSIAAASIIAKVSRDKLINNLSLEFPDYEWDKNKGYGTKKHIEAIKKFGLTIHHRKSFSIRKQI